CLEDRTDAWRVVIRPSDIKSPQAASTGKAGQGPDFGSRIIIVKDGFGAVASLSEFFGAPLAQTDPMAGAPPGELDPQSSQLEIEHGARQGDIPDGAAEIFSPEKELSIRVQDAYLSDSARPGIGHGVNAGNDPDRKTFFAQAPLQQRKRDIRTPLIVG